MSSMIKIWDIPTRLFHWTLVLLFVFLIISGESDDLMEWHFYAGYLLAGLIVFRLIWGLLGTRYARFSALIIKPSAVFSYTKKLIQTEHTPHLGHTPPGSLMVVAMLLLLPLQLVTGMMSTDDILWNGPLYNYISDDIAEIAGEIHETVQGLLQALVGIHVLAIIFYKVKFKEQLVPAMLHGKKPGHDNDAARENMSAIKFLAAIIPSLALSYWLFSLPI